MATSVSQLSARAMAQEEGKIIQEEITDQKKDTETEDDTDVICCEL